MTEVFYIFVDGLNFWVRADTKIEAQEVVSFYTKAGYNCIID